MKLWRQHLGTAWGSECRQTHFSGLSAMALSHLTYPTGNYWCWRPNVKNIKAWVMRYSNRTLLLWLSHLTQARKIQTKERQSVYIPVCFEHAEIPQWLVPPRPNSGWDACPCHQIPFIPNLQSKYFRLTFPIVIIATSWEGFLHFFHNDPPPFFLSVKG